VGGMRTRGDALHGCNKRKKEKQNENNTLLTGGGGGDFNLFRRPANRKK